MARQNINVGTNANDATGDTLRVAFGKVNNNFVELYASGGGAGAQGVQGVQGTTGSAGSAGSTGVQGVQGTTGSAGSQGVQGIQGLIGVQGTQGLSGVANTGNVTFQDNIVVGNGVGQTDGLYLAAGSGQVANLQYLRLRGGDDDAHIHFDTANVEAYDLYLGDDNKYVKLERGYSGNVVIGSSSNYGKVWNFDTNGNLNVPGPLNFQQNATIPLGPPAANGANDRVILWDFQGTGSGYNYAIGAEGNHIWFSMDVNNGTGGFKYYSRNNEIMKIQDDGVLKLTNNIAWSNSNTVIQSAPNGNGEGYSVLNIIPDVDKYPNDQYIIIDPGVTPAHVHLRAGGSMDDSSAILSLGGDASYFRLNSGPNPEAYIASNNKIWTFAQDGTMQFPVMTYANLPLATTAGIRSFISDSSLDATNWGAVTSGGGSNTVPVFSDGTDWRIG